MTDVLQLFPANRQEYALNGLYLGLHLHQQAVASDVLIYANYIASLDGRIALRNTKSKTYEVPANLANTRDWRLYQELAAQADIMLTSARYFRQLAKGRAQDLLPVGKGEAYADLIAWRQQQGLKPQPDLAIMSNSLDIPTHALTQWKDRHIIIFTSEQADENKIEKLTDSGIEVVIAGQQQVEGKQLKTQLIKHHYRSAYMIAGPEVHRTLIKAQVLDRLFLTTRFNLLASNDFHSILNGYLEQPVALDILSLYLDQHPDTQQLFAQYGFKKDPTERQ